MRQCADNFTVACNSDGVATVTMDFKDMKVHARVFCACSLDCSPPQRHDTAESADQRQDADGA
ncbi:MAG: hypothetical protein ACPIOQ_49020 [Promethearchaeia archaeon]